MEAEGLRFIYCAILPQTGGFVNTFSKNFIFFLQGKNVSRPNTQIHCNLRIRTAPDTSQSPVFRVAVRRGEQTFTTTRMSIGKINKILCKNPIEILTGSCFHEISRQKSSTLLIYKPPRMRYNILARRKQDVPSQRCSSSRTLWNINLMISSVQRRQTLHRFCSHRGYMRTST